MNLTSKTVEEYCIAHSDSPIDLLNHIERETHIRTTKGNMMSGHIQGAFMGAIIDMLQAKNALEIGTFTGYTAVWIAENLPDDGLLTTIEVNPETHWLANHFLEDYNNRHKINSILGDAKSIIPSLNKVWDFVLIDAGKNDNGFFYEMILPYVRSGGYILVDNVIWKSKMMEEEMDKRTALIDSFNKLVAKDDRVQSLMLPLRDGLTFLRKK